MTLDPDRYHTDLAAAFARGSLGLAGSTPGATAIERAQRAGLRLHRFKRSHLPRVQRVLGVLRGLWPETLLDVGSGRGTFLWPLLADRADLRVVSLDRDTGRVGQLSAVTRGGVARVSVVRADVTRLPWRDGAFAGATALEVLEHLADPLAAARELVRVTRRFVVASVPSKEDENPEHLRVFSPDDLVQLFRAAGAARVDVSHVLNHRIVVAQ